MNFYAKNMFKINFCHSFFFIKKCCHSQLYVSSVELMEFACSISSISTYCFRILVVVDLLTCIG